MKPFVYFDFNTRKKNRIHLVNHRKPYAFCGQKVPEGATEGVEADLAKARERLCPGCRGNYHKQGQGFEGLP